MKFLQNKNRKAQAFCFSFETDDYEECASQMPGLKQEYEEFVKKNAAMDQ